MNEPYIFLSVGGVANDAQELFIKTIEDRIASEGFIPKTVGRNTFSEESPLKTINKLMVDCSGTIIIALERTYFPEGIEKRGGAREKILREVKLPTPWNQIEAAMSYSKGQPLMIIMEEDLKKEGLLDTGQEWFILLVKPDVSSLNTPAFNGVLASWKGKVAEYHKSKKEAKTLINIDPSSMTIGMLVNNLRPSHLWSILASLIALIAGAFAAGTFFPK